MLTPYEVAVKSVIPAVRRMVAKRLISKYGLTQKEAAELLGVSQSAISRYGSEERGVAIDLESHKDVVERVEVLAREIASGLVAKAFIAKRIDEICDYSIKKGYMCEFHGRIDPEVTQINCSVCLEES
jgi:Predicted transcriptional regulator